MGEMGWEMLYLFNLEWFNIFVESVVEYYYISVVSFVDVVVDYNLSCI